MYRFGISCWVKYFCKGSLYCDRGFNLLTSALKPGLSSTFAGKLFGSYCLPFSMTAVSVECRGLFSLIRHVHFTLCRLFVKVGVSVTMMDKEVGGVPSFAHHGFLTRSAHWPVLLTMGLAHHETKVHPHHALGVFLLDQGSRQFSHFSLNKNSRSHVASWRVSCRVASLIFSSVSIRYTGKTIYHDRANMQYDN